MDEWFAPNPACPWVTAKHGINTKVYAVDYVNADLSGGNLGIYVYTHHKKFLRYGVPFALNLPGSTDNFATRPNFILDMTGGGFMPDRGETGAFEIACGDAVVRGMGLPANRHVIYVITFGLTADPNKRLFHG